MQVTRIFDILKRYEEFHPEKQDVFGVKENGKWNTISLKEYLNYVNAFSYGLLSLGFQKGDKIATVSNNRPEWNFVDMGMSQVGVIHVPIYPTISLDEYLHILNHSEAKIIIVSDEALYQKIAPLLPQMKTVNNIYTFNKIEGAKHWSEIVELGKSSESPILRGELKNRKDSIQKDDLASIIYTSGTTGVPKGVMLSHWNFMYQCEKLMPIVKDITVKDRILSFLPLCHVLERMGNYLFQYTFSSIYYAESTEKVPENMREVKPSAFVTVPRLLERVFDRIMSVGGSLTGVKKNLFYWAVNLGLEFDFYGKSAIYAAKLKVANKLIFKKWREALGGKVRMIICGGAALQPRLARIFWAAGIPVQEGFGLTETSPVICANYPAPPKIMITTTGVLLDPENQQLKIAEDGEILFKGPNLMLGYYREPEKTAEVIDEEGWFHTGDIGEIVDGKFLRITDRKKEMFKLSTGKYVAPQIVENILKESIFIEQAMIVGDNEKFAAALICPNFEFLHNWCARKNLHFREHEDILKNERVIKRFEKEVNKCNERLGKTEQVKKFILLNETWTPETGELSPTLKLKRRLVKQKHLSEIAKFYAKE